MEVQSQPYPELEAIPPAPTRSSVSSAGANRSSLFPIPKWVAAVFSTFPLHTYPPAKVISPSLSHPPVRPVLYVAPHLNRDGSLSRTSEAEAEADQDTFLGDDEKHNSSSSRRVGWSSSDPIALRWQMELMFRGVDFDVHFIDPTQNWGPARSMPFLHFPPSYQPKSPSSRGSAGSSTSPSLLPATNLPHFLDNYFPTSKPELGEKSRTDFPDKATELEARSWENLLKGRIMAGVLLAVLLSPQSMSYLEQHHQAYLSSLVASHNRNTFLDQQLRRISALNPAASSSASTSASSYSSSASSSAQPTTRLPGWEVGFLGWIGARSSSAATSLASTDLDSRGGGDTPGAAFANPEVDQDKIVSDAVAALQALGDRTKASLSNDNSEEAKFLLSATRPTSMDALAFAAIHTILTLAATPQAQGNHNNEPLRQLKQTLDNNPWLVNWSRQVWKKFVRDLERT